MSDETIVRRALALLRTVSHAMTVPQTTHVGLRTRPVTRASTRSRERPREKPPDAPPPPDALLPPASPPPDAPLPPASPPPPKLDTAPASASPSGERSADDAAELSAHALAHPGVHAHELEALRAHPGVAVVGSEMSSGRTAVVLACHATGPAAEQIAADLPFLSRPCFHVFVVPQTREEIKEQEERDLELLRSRQSSRKRTSLTPAQIRSVSRKLDF